MDKKEEKTEILNVKSDKKKDREMIRESFWEIDREEKILKKMWLMLKSRQDKPKWHEDEDEKILWLFWFSKFFTQFSYYVLYEDMKIWLRNGTIKPKRRIFCTIKNLKMETQHDDKLIW
jgi:hypothetical protein